VEDGVVACLGVGVGLREGLGGGQPDGEAGAALGERFDGDVSFVAFDDGVGAGEAEALAAEFGGDVGVEEIVEVVGGD